MRLILLGATGVVGQAVLQRALADDSILRICAPTRRALLAHRKLDNPVLDFSNPLPDADWWRADAVICCLGTTIGVAGSKPAFYSIDHDLVIACARKAQAAGTTIFALNSSLGANANSKNFYLRTKGETEADLQALEFERLVLVRPSLIDAKRTESRPGEQIGRIASRLLKPVIPARYQSVTAGKIARCLIDQVTSQIEGEQASPVKGVVVVESDAINRLSDSHNASDQR